MERVQLRDIFFEMWHTVSELKWTIVKKNYGYDRAEIKTRLLQREVYWIVTLETKSPNGLNESCSFNVFL